MSVAIIIITHGFAAKQLLMTTEMLIGKQKNIASIDFVPGENADTLIEKYNKKLNEFDVSQGVLFLVDMWGGSPFNAANQIIESKDKDKYDIVTGVNVPMLVATLLYRDDEPTFNELVSTAIEMGRREIKALNSQHIINKKQNNFPPTSLLQVANSPTQGNMVIALARIDDRLIHGQVATRWTKETNVKRIIVVSDEVAKDHVRSNLLKQVAPPGVIAHVVNIEKCIRVLNNPKYSGERVMLLFTNPTDVLHVVDGGIKIKSVNIGGMAYCNGKTQVNNAISIDNEDIDAFNQLSKRGIELEVRKVSSDSKLDMLTLIKKVKK
ncbi:PTS system mannose-specific EIIAB component [Arsenophonus endosymbiont of Aleurodicus dispersus]|uniref:PTS mannose transporter subunit IIAB n=1 Tax=Arsenophonus endosymbiont of Aleurodicus dispersus TaxID=235559 RepID=UPI000EAE8980|nr:PTS mannose transporter subunit IIAB [Arsenophonus endosymbiont of Aleurodicus dispersus]VAY02262.1 PTS system mannose-specific EIIAB component [Arsenophonus endosymbiont of Aleurodicus dispersus]